MQKGLRLIRIHGIDVFVHFSWWIIVVLLAYSLRADFFPAAYPELSAGMYWLMGSLAAVLLFVSVIFHELTHSFVARAFKIPVDHITLFFFGGVASLPTEHIKPKTEFWMALSGPLFSLALAGVLYFVSMLSLPLVPAAIVGYLWRVNFALALFNLVPGYPLDGGRVFRALLMFYYHDLVKATRIASMGGKVFGGMLVFLGFLQMISGAGGGLWFVLIGGFIWFVARASYETVVVQAVLAKIPVSRLVRKPKTTLQSTDKFRTFIRLYVSGEDSAFLVMSGTKVAGVVDAAHVNVPRNLWANLDIRAAVVPVKPLGLRDNAYTALRQMEEQGVVLLPVVEKGKVLGVVTKNRIVHQMAFTG
jgi:Zn-dependent protease